VIQGNAFGESILGIVKVRVGMNIRWVPDRWTDNRKRGAV
jgi:hypothetical protein